MEYLLIIVPIGIVGIGGLLVRQHEKKKWNNGYCAECGLEWQQYDMDSQGGRMYRCENWHFCDISYNVDK